MYTVHVDSLGSGSQGTTEAITSWLLRYEAVADCDCYQGLHHLLIAVATRAKFMPNHTVGSVPGISVTAKPLATNEFHQVQSAQGSKSCAFPSHFEISLTVVWLVSSMQATAPSLDYQGNHTSWATEATAYRDNTDKNSRLGSRQETITNLRDFLFFFSLALWSLITVMATSGVEGKKMGKRWRGR